MERVQTLVIDASIALKWFVEEVYTEKALEILDHLTKDVLPAVPSLFFYEVANVLRYKPEFGINDIKQVLSALFAFGFLVESLNEELGGMTIDIAYLYGITIYDASYIALSRKNQCDFITFS